MKSLKSTLIVLIFAYSPFSLFSSDLSNLIWSQSFDLSNIADRRLPFIQELKEKILVYTGKELWEVSKSGTAIKIADVPYEIRKLRAESFYFSEDLEECFVVCLHNPEYNFYGMYLFSFNIFDGKVTEVMTFPDTHLSADWDIPFEFDNDCCRVGYWANGNVYFFQINLKDKQVRGFISRLQEGFTFVLPITDNLYYIADHVGKQKFLYNPVDDKLLWKDKAFLTVPIVNSNRDTVFIDDAGKGIFIHREGEPSKIFHLNTANRGVIGATSLDDKRVCFLSQKDILMLDVESGKVLWQLANDFGAERILRFDNLGVIVSDAFVLNRVRTLRAISNKGEFEWTVKFCEEKVPALDPIVRLDKLLVLVSYEKTRCTINAYEVQ